MSVVEFLSHLYSLDVKLWADGDRLRCWAPEGVMTPALRAELVDRKSEILTFLNRAKAAASLTTPPIQPILRNGDLPLSFAQWRLWFLDQLEPGSPIYNLPGVLRLEGELDVGALHESLNEIVRRHETLRTTFADEGGQPGQTIAPVLGLPPSLVDLSDLPEGEQETQIQRLVREEVQRPFELAQGPLLRAQLLRLSPQEHLLILNTHHIVSDGWSIGVFTRELVALYEAFSMNRPSPLAELSIQYADYAHWQREWLQGPVGEEQVVYWKRQLQGLPPRLELCTDHARPPVQSYQGASRAFVLSPSLSESLQELSRRVDATLFMTLLAAFKVLLNRYSGQADIVVGTPIANRNRVEIEGLIGFFVNTLVLRSDLTGDPSFEELLGRVRRVALEAYAHQDLPFERLVEELQPQRTLSYPPLFQVMFIFESAPLEPLELPGLTLSPLDMDQLEVDTGTAKFDLTLSVKETMQGLAGTVEYNTDLFETQTIARMVGHFQTLLEGIVANPEQRLSDLPLLTKAERRQLLYEWNDTRRAYTWNMCLPELFEAQVARTPDVVAVIFKDEHLTYRELNCRANQLAHHLQALGIGPETLVGIYMDRSLELVVGLIAILKAGGAYLPLDPAHPQARLASILQDAGVTVVLTQVRWVAKLSNHSCLAICLDFAWDDIAQENKENPVCKATSENLAYEIYTSGSTGKPKGVIVEQKQLLNRFAWMWDDYPFTDNDIGCQKTTVSFVDSIWELLGPLLQGIRTVIVPDKALKDPSQLVLFLADHHVTRIWLVPSLLRVMLETWPSLQDHLPHLRFWVTSGEPLSWQLFQRFREAMPQSMLINLYGTSEVFDATLYEAGPDSRGLLLSVPIGHPIANVQVYILDFALNPVPVGVPGELYVGGVGLARGYLNRPQLTAQAFLPNPFGDEPGTRLYKTGDLVRYLPKGDIEFLGRIDHQVKVRGFRIELGEIETVLVQAPAVREAVTVVREVAPKGGQSIPEDKRLVAYFVPEKEQAPTVSDLRHFLQQRLPDYMLPSVFVPLDALPLTSSGKVDREVLPAPEQIRPKVESEFVAPRTPTERAVVEIWTQVLGVEKIGVYDNFFELGGHSLLATQVISWLRSTLEVELSVTDFFEAPTVAGLAEALVQRQLEQADQALLSQLLAEAEQMSPDELNITLDLPLTRMIEGSYD